MKLTLALKGARFVTKNFARALALVCVEYHHRGATAVVWWSDAQLHYGVTLSLIKNDGGRRWGECSRFISAYLRVGFMPLRFFYFNVAVLDK